MYVDSSTKAAAIPIVDDVYILRRNAEHLVRDVIHTDQRCKVLIECAETGAGALELYPAAPLYCAQPSSRRQCDADNNQGVGLSYRTQAVV